MPLWLNLPIDSTLGIFADPSSTILAYLDPGTGSYALQIILASLFGGMFAIKQSWAELKIWASARFGQSSKGAERLTTVKPAATPDAGFPTQEIARSTVHGHSTAKPR